MISCGYSPVIWEYISTIVAISLGTDPQCFMVQGAEVEHVIKSVMRKQALAAQQAALNLCHTVDTSPCSA